MSTSAWQALVIMLDCLAMIVTAVVLYRVRTTVLAAVIFALVFGGVTALVQVAG